MPNDSDVRTCSDSKSQASHANNQNASGIVQGSTLLMRSPEGEVQEVEATPAKIVPLMVRGWRQVTDEEVTPDVRRADAGNPDLLR